MNQGQIWPLSLRNQESCGSKSSGLLASLVGGMAGVVKHPAEWPFCGYNEIQTPRQRYSLIDYKRLIPLLQMKDMGELQQYCRERIEEALATGNRSRESKWTESIAVGNPAEAGLRRHLKGLESRRKVGRLLEVRKAMNSANRLFLTGAILPLKMGF